MQTTARFIRKGDRVTYCGETFTADAVSRDETSGLMKVEVKGTYPRFIDGAREVEVARPVVEEKPFWALTRDYKPNGDADKRRFSFKTEGQALAWARKTPRHIVSSNF